MKEPTTYELAQLARAFQERGIPNSVLNHVKVPRWHEIGQCLEVAGLGYLNRPARERIYRATEARVAGTETRPAALRVPFCIARHGGIISVVPEKADHKGGYQGWYQRRMHRAYRLSPGSSEVMLAPSGGTTSATPAYPTAVETAARLVDEMLDTYTTLGSATDKRENAPQHPPAPRPSPSAGY